MARKILVVEDDRNISDLIRMYLEKEGFEVHTAFDGGTALEKFRDVQPVLVLLDIMLPVMDGWGVCQRIRAESRTPIIMLTAKSEVLDRVTGLEMGADDYLVKPFGIMTLVSRIKAVLRRCNKQEDSSTLSAHGITMDVENHEVRVFGEDVELTKKEFAILQLFLQNPGKVFNRETLMHEVWGEEFVGESRTVDMHIKTLRQKLGDAAASIKTVVGIGYRMEVVG